MSKSKLEYIWLDGYKPTQSLRSKTKIVEDFSGKLGDVPMWAFDGSSTQQAEGGSSDCLLKPVAIYPDPIRRNGFLIMNEVLNANGSPHEWITTVMYVPGRAVAGSRNLNDFPSASSRRRTMSPGVSPSLTRYRTVRFPRGGAGAAARAAR